MLNVPLTGTPSARKRVNVHGKRSDGHHIVALVAAFFLLVIQIGPDNDEIVARQNPRYYRIHGLGVRFIFCPARRCGARLPAVRRRCPTGRRPTNRPHRSNHPAAACRYRWRPSQETPTGSPAQSSEASSAALLRVKSTSTKLNELRCVSPSVSPWMLSRS